MINYIDFNDKINTIILIIVSEVIHC